MEVKKETLLIDEEGGELTTCPECGEPMPVWEDYNCSYCQHLDLMELIKKEEEDEKTTTD